MGLSISMGKVSHLVVAKLKEKPSYWFLSLEIFKNMLIVKKQQYLVHVLLEITTTRRTLRITKMRRHLLGGIWNLS
jgi:hypothetical protein